MNNIEITNRENVFLAGVMEGHRPEEAAKKAGYTHGSRDAYPLLGQKKVRDYFKKIIIGQAETEGIAIAYNYLITIIRDKDADKRLRADCAKFIYAQHVPAQKALEASNPDEKAITEMSPQELKQYIDDIENELSNRALPTQPIDSMI